MNRDPRTSQPISAPFPCLDRSTATPSLRCAFSSLCPEYSNVSPVISCFWPDFVHCLYSQVKGSLLSCNLRVVSCLKHTPHIPRSTLMALLVDGRFVCLVAFEDPHLGEDHSSSTATVPSAFVDVSVTQIVLQGGVANPIPNL